MHKLKEELIVKIITAPYFLATKIEAFLGRGNDDYLMSHDMEDIITLLDRRDELVEDIKDCSSELRQYLSEKLQEFRNDEQFIDSITGHLLPDAASQGRYSIIMKRIESIIQS